MPPVALLLVAQVSADTISINLGGDTQVVPSYGAYIEDVWPQNDTAADASLTPPSSTPPMTHTDRRPSSICGDHLEVLTHGP